MLTLDEQRVMSLYLEQAKREQANTHADSGSMAGPDQGYRSNHEPHRGIVESLARPFSITGRQRHRRAALDAAQASSTDPAVSELVSTAGTHQELSRDSSAMLLALGKTHLREISEDEFARYAQHFGPSHKQELCRQWRDWVCPNDEFLDLIGLLRTDHWQIIRDRAKSVDVRMNAMAEMQKPAFLLPQSVTR
jgi:hypothetical protein